MKKQAKEHYNMNFKKTIFALCISLLFIGCHQQKQKDPSAKLKVVTTTTMITDMVSAIGGDLIEVKGLMGSGVDPHLYKASEGDLRKLSEAEIIFYNGLHLEGKLEDVFEKMKHLGKQTVAVSSKLDKSHLISSKNFASNFDPHIWFSPKKWIACVDLVVNELATIDAKNAITYLENGKTYKAQIEKLDFENASVINSIPIEKRILITAHDAFNYFGQTYSFEVIGLQGLSTATEAGVKDVQNLANFIIEKDVKAIFIETSVPKRTIEALQASVKSKGHEVKIGGELFSDALGNPDTEEGTYLGMYKHNVSTIVEALK